MILTISASILTAGSVGDWITGIYWGAIGLFLLFGLLSFTGQSFIRIFDILFFKKYIIPKDTYVSEKIKNLKRYHKLDHLDRNYNDGHIYNTNLSCMFETMIMKEKGDVVELPAGTICKIKWLYIWPNYNKISVDGKTYYIEDNCIQRLKK